MNATIRRICLRAPVLRNVYRWARSTYHFVRLDRAARDYFLTYREYREALADTGGQIVQLRTNDGLTLTVRRNHMDAVIIREIFLDKCYTRGLNLPANPIVVDIGGYIGDFAIYAARYLGARKIVVCEPSPNNWALLNENVRINGYEDRIIAINKAVTSGQDVMMNVDAPSRGQARVSAYGPADVQTKRIPGITLTRLMEDQALSLIDLLKIDCEGGEYDILLSTPAEVLDRVQHIVFEYHEIDGFKSNLRAVLEKLYNSGYSITEHGFLVSASRL